MPLQAGTRLGQYEIVTLVGAGGMGEVYRARDTRLNRHVALKVLYEAVTADSSRSARFEREAQLLAALNHANIASIYGIEGETGRLALIMELVEGDTLADRIARGALPEEEAIAVAAKICDGLEYAHEHGIVHRDLKPANIKVTPAGDVKILDFGLAKALDAGPISQNISQSPTFSIVATRAGVILGTAAYMSPEQARGQSADRRSDIWSFGCVLFEMLAGKRAFEDQTISDTLASVLRGDPSWDSLPPRTSPSLVRLLRRCLEKDARYRLQHIGDARLELRDVKDVSTVESPKTRQSRPWWYFAAACVAVAAAAGTAGRLAVPVPTPAPVSRFAFPVPVGPLTTTNAGFEVALSPDGRTLLFSAPGLGVHKRALNAVDFEPLRGAELGVAPFFSPDGAWVGFFEENSLKKVPVEGGLPTTLAQVPPIQARATWGEDGSIVIGGSRGLFSVSADGGSLQQILAAPEGGFFSQPRFLPGSKAVLVRTAGEPAGGTVGRIEVLELATLARHVLLDGTAPQLAPTGDLLFQQDGALWAIRFDSNRFAVEGRALRVVEPIPTQPNVVAFAAAPDGSLAFVQGGSNSARSLVWLDRAGRSTPALDVRGEFQSPRLSPDGKAVIVSVSEEANLDLWRYEFERGTRLRLTTDGRSRRTVWSPDGKQVAYYSAEEKGGGSELYAMPATGGEPKALLKRPGLQYPDSWSPDGRFLLFEDGEGGGTRISSRRDLWLLPIGSDEPQPLLVTRFYERGAVFAPNGRWIAFVTDESGRPEIYVQPFPGPGSKIPVSINGGLQPVWSRDGRELFYREGDSLMAASIQFDPFRAATPQKLFELPASSYNMDQNFADYDVSSDGRFLAIRGENAGRFTIQMVLNWTGELRRALEQ